MNMNQQPQPSAKYKNLQIKSAKTNNQENLKKFRSETIQSGKKTGIRLAYSDL
jgi:hypothetical protein